MAGAALQVFTLEEPGKWDGIVRTFKSFDAYYLSGYGKAFYLHGDGDPLLFYYNDGKISGINVVMKRDISEDPHFKDVLNDRFYDLATPYGYGGWLIEARDPCAGKETLEWLFRDYESWCLRNNIVSEFVRFHPMICNHKFVRDYYDVLPLGEVVHIDLSSPEKIWENISSKNRNVIRKAVKNGIRIYNGRYPGIYRTFKAIYNATMDKDEAEKYYYFEDSFYASLLEDLPENAQVFWAEKDGAVIAASVMLEANGFMNYHLSGSLREYSSLAPTNLLLYKAALWGCEHGMRTLYLGGGVGSGEDSLFKFKRAFFKGDLHRFHIGRKIFNPEVYQELIGMRAGSIQNLNYFPVYRG